MPGLNRQKESQTMARGKQNRLTSALVALASGAVCVAGAHGQYALDNNLQQGTGGVNPAAQQTDYAARNQVIYGNVSGLGYFRGQLDYGDPRAFQGRLGSDDLFRFQAQSFSSTNLPAGVGTTIPSSVVVQRSFTAPPPGAAPVYQGGAMNPSGLIAPGGGVYDPTRGAYINASVDQNTSQTQLAEFQAAQGRKLQIIGSSLMGVRRQEVNPYTSINRFAPGNPNGTANQPALDEQTQRFGQVYGTYNPAERQTMTLEMAGLVEQSMLPLPKSSSQVQGQLLPLTVTGQPGKTLDDQVTDIETRMFSILGSAQADPGQDIYMDRLRAIRGYRPEPKEDKPNQGNGEAQPEGPLANPLLAAPETDDAREAREEREAAIQAHLDRVLGNDQKQNKEKPKDQNNTGDEPEEDDMTRREQYKSVLEGTSTFAASGRTEKERQAYQRFLERMRYDLPAIRSFAGQGESAVNNIMRKAEDLLAQEQYMSAEREFGKLVAALPKYPLARVGLIHAQFGAGMLQSASLNLRQLLTQHPELAATRYDAALLPKADRLKIVRDKLDDMADNARRPDAGIALAYLGYQTGNDKLVAYGLDKAQAKAPAEPTIILLRQVWLDQKTNESKTEETKD